jgi:putative transposase
MSNRRTQSREFQARVAMEAISGRKTIQEIAADHAIHPIQVCQLPSDFENRATGALEK